MLADLGGKVAVITGGGSGIGAALARACADEGMRVVVVDIDESRIEAVAESLDAATTGVLPFVADVADPSSVDRLAEVVYDTFGSTDLLCNNAGVSPLGCLWEFTPCRLGLDHWHQHSWCRELCPQLHTAHDRARKRRSRCQHRVRGGISPGCEEWRVRGNETCRARAV